MIYSIDYIYRNDLKFSDRQVWANSVDPGQTAPEQSDQGLHCLPFHLDLLDPLLFSKTTVRILEYERPHDKTNKMTVRPAKTQIILGIRPV